MRIISCVCGGGRGIFIYSQSKWFLFVLFCFFYVNGICWFSPSTCTKTIKVLKVMKYFIPNTRSEAGVHAGLDTSVHIVSHTGVI